jgi:alkylhydroperoxidase/carboxymuconolactone decarboxylase family protein YurZ
MGLSTKRNDAMVDVKTPMRAPWGDIAPRLTEISNNVLFDDVWRRPGLSPRDRSLITGRYLRANRTTSRSFGPLLDALAGMSLTVSP